METIGFDGHTITVSLSAMARSTPGAGDAVASIQNAAIDGNAAAASRPQDHRKHDVLTRTRAVRGFGNSQAVGVIRAAHLAMQRVAQIAVKRLANHPCGVGVLHCVGDARNCAGDGNADRRAAMKLALDQFDAFLDRAHGAIVIMPRRGHAMAVKFAAVGLEGDEFDFGAAEIDADTKFALWRIPR